VQENSIKIIYSLFYSILLLIIIVTIINYNSNNHFSLLNIQAEKNNKGGEEKEQKEQEQTKDNDKDEENNNKKGNSDSMQIDPAYRSFFPIKQIVIPSVYKTKPNGETYRFNQTNPNDKVQVDEGENKKVFTKQNMMEAGE